MGPRRGAAAGRRVDAGGALWCTGVPVGFAGVEKVSPGDQASESAALEYLAGDVGYEKKGRVPMRAATGRSGDRMSYSTLRLAKDEQDPSSLRLARTFQQPGAEEM